jgi:GTP-binding protein
MSKFIDHASIRVSAGSGGSGSKSMRRELFVPRGGPDGGDGGRGGSIILEASTGLRTLIDFSYQSVFQAEDGQAGAKQQMFGRAGKDTLLKVPLGTLVKDADSGEVLADLVADGERWVAAKGGRGGRGNVHFKTSVRQAPTLAEKGEPGQTRSLALELKLLADVALVGFPNAGKSTFLARVSAARPKIADYPFTTLVPQLGVVRLGEESSFVLADLPGLIEGASEGKGLGLQFLKHIERTRVLLFLLDGSQHDERNLWKDYGVLKKELKSYHPGLAKLPRLAAISKADTSESKRAFKDLKPKFSKEKTKLYLLSSASGEGVDTLLRDIEKKIRNAPVSVIAQDAGTERAKEKVYRPAARFSLHGEDGQFILEGREVSKWVAMTDFANEEAVQRLHRIFKKMGVSRALKDAGAKSGDTVRVGNEVMEYEPENT